MGYSDSEWSGFMAYGDLLSRSGIFLGCSFDRFLSYILNYGMWGFWITINCYTMATAQKGAVRLGSGIDLSVPDFWFLCRVLDMDFYVLMGM